MYLTVYGKEVYYEEKGIGKPILFVHGWGGTTNSLRQLFELASQHHRAIILDLPGFGHSENPDENWGVEEYSKLLIEFIKNLKLDHPIYFGHSFGGSLGIYIASNYPTIIEKLILCNSAYKRSNKQSRSVRFLKKYIYPYVPFAQKLEKRLRYIIYRIFFPNSDLVKYPHLEPNFRKIMTQDLTPYAPRIHIPTYIMWGEEDTYTPVSFAYELNKVIIHSILKVFPEKRHNLPLRYPELVWENMKQFVA